MSVCQGNILEVGGGPTGNKEGSSRSSESHSAGQQDNDLENKETSGWYGGEVHGESGRGGEVMDNIAHAAQEYLRRLEPHWMDHDPED